jgi:hypothetical protein
MAPIELSGSDSFVPDLLVRRLLLRVPTVSELVSLLLPAAIAFISLLSHNCSLATTVVHSGLFSASYALSVLDESLRFNRS